MSESQRALFVAGLPSSDGHGIKPSGPHVDKLCQGAGAKIDEIHVRSCIRWLASTSLSPLLLSGVPTKPSSMRWC